MAFFGNTIDTCEGTSCARCRINIDFCACTPRKLAHRSVEERITAQGIVPTTDHHPARTSPRRRQPKKVAA